MSSRCAAYLAPVVASVVIVSALVAGPVAIGDARANLDPLLLIRGHSPTKLGADSQGNLWGWNERTSRLLVVSSSAGLVSALDLPPSRAIDFDAAYGTVLLDLYGKRLSWRDGRGAERASWPLDHEAADVAWVAPGRAALSTTRSSPPIELWDLERGRRLASFGDAPALELAPGATLLRHLDLDFDETRSILYALDSVEGLLTAHALDGSERGHRRVPNPRREQVVRWLADADREARAKGSVETPLYTILRLAVGPEGVAWVVTGCSEDRRTASLESWAPGGIVRKFEAPLADACCSLAFTVWQDRLVFTHKPDAVAQRCVLDRRLP